MTPYYQDGLVTIYHGDCREWMPEADVIVTDPPYGIGHFSKRPGAEWRYRKIANDDSTGVRDAILEGWAGPAIVFGSCRSMPPANYRAVLVWDKGGHVGMGDLSLPWKQNWEHIYIIGNGFRGRRGSGILRTNAIAPWAGLLSHPHEKPVSLMVELVQKCPPGVVLDPFMGSGSTLVAAKSVNRPSIGIEIEERYCEIAARRCSQEVLGLSFVS